MTKNKGKGGKNRKKGKNEADDNKRDLVLKEDGEEYAQVISMSAGPHCLAKFIDGTERTCHIRGTMQKKIYISAGDIVLVRLKDYQGSKADIILKYMPDEVRTLKSIGALPDNFSLTEGIIAGDVDEEDEDAYVDIGYDVDVEDEDLYYGCIGCDLDEEDDY